MNYQGFLNAGAVNSSFNQIQFLISMAMAKLNTSAVVEVMAVTNDGDDSAVGFVNIRPMVGQVAADGSVIPHQTVFNIPYFRLQGGANAIILDPQVGDIGFAVFADRDMSVVKNTKAAGAPGSFRQHSMADGMYLGGILNGVPTQYVRFSETGIEIKSTGDIDLNAPDGDINLSATNINLTTSGAVAIESATLTHNGINVGATHTHGGVQIGSDNTLVPNP